MPPKKETEKKAPVPGVNMPFGADTLKHSIEQYEHSDKTRASIPHVGLVTPASDPDTGAKKKYQYDPHLDPALQWAGKTEHTSFEVPTVSLHVHERIDPKSIIESIRKNKEEALHHQPSLFEEFKKPLREALDFYKHKEGWSNRLIAGDSLLVMNSLLEKEGMAGKVQMVYFDPPYGIKYGSNFQPFVNKRDVKDGKDEDLSAEPEMIKAFRDTWELGIHSYLTYLRDRLLLARELLHESGSIFVQIGDENVHLVRNLLDEVFGKENFLNLITVRKTLPLGSSGLANVSDFMLWYSKDNTKNKYRELYTEKGNDSDSPYSQVMLKDGKIRKATKEEIENPNNLPEGAKLFRYDKLTSSGYTPSCFYDFELNGEIIKPQTKSWSTNKDGMLNLIKKGRVMKTGTVPNFIRYLDDFPVKPLHNIWSEFQGAREQIYVVQTNEKAIQRCLLMSTDPGDLVLDITCGSGTTAFVAEQWGRRWITCDTSRVALTLAKQRLMTAKFDYYQLAHPKEGVGSGFVYKTVPHVTLKSIANNLPPGTETLYDQPLKDNNKVRITGPFTVEAVPAPYVKSSTEEDKATSSKGEATTSIARSGETLRQAEWREELFNTGVRAKGGNMLKFSRLETMVGTRYIQAEGETIPEKKDKPQKVLVVFGPEFAPLEQRTVENAWQEARNFKPDILLFCAFQFDEEAAKDIDELTPDKAGMQLLKAQMNADLLTDDLRKKRSSNESFWLVGQPDIKLRKLKNGKVEVEVMGFDYYNPKTGDVESGGKNNIAMWMLDTNYDNRSLFPSQVFFPMAGEKDGWSKLARNLKADIDEEKIEAFRGTVSLPFEPGETIAVKIVDDRGIESLRVMKV